VARKTLALFAVLSACAIPRRPAELPPRTEGWIAVLSGEMPGPISQVARHAWIVANVPGETRYRRYELYHSGSDPFAYFGDGDVALHGVIRYTPDELQGKLQCLEREERRYHEEHPGYLPIPGPNSNTIVDQLLRRCGVHVELPATAIGRDYRGPLGASVTSVGTGVQLETWIVGAKVGLEEGVEAHLFDLPLGVHFWPPGLTVPVNPGRIGVDGDAHRPSERTFPFRSERDDPREYGVASLWMWGEYTRIRRPESAGGLADRATVGLTARAIHGRTLGHAFGADLELGAGFPAGFAYAARLYPIGAGYMLGANTYAGLFAGFGASGVSARVPGALEIPVELRLEADAGRDARVGFRAAVAAVPYSDARHVGSRVLPFGDELVLGAFARVGRVPPCSCPRAGRGYFFGLERREVMRTYWLGLAFGVEVDFGG
jgi:hypothetical protein